MNTQNRSARIIAMLWVSSMGGAFIAFVTQVVIARNLEAIEYGIFSSALGLVILLTPLIGFGIPSFWLKAYGEEGRNAIRWVAPSLKFLVLALTAVAIMLALYAYFGLSADQGRWVVAVLGSYILSQSVMELMGSTFQIQGRYSLLACSQVLLHLSRFIVIVIMIVAYTQLRALDAAIGYVYAALLYIAMCVYLFFTSTLAKYRFSPADILRTKKTIRALVKETWPFGAASALYLIYFHSATVLLGHFGLLQEAGYFNIINTILQAVYIFPAVVYQKYLMPKIHRLASTNTAELYQLYKRGNKLMLVSGLFAMSCIIILTPYALPVIFGTQYREAVVPLMIIALSIPLRFISTSSGSMLATKKNMRIRVFHMGYVALINVIMNVILIPSIGIYAPVISAIACDAIILIAYKIAVRKYVADTPTV